jgi:branched-chain amino acid transport system substrate-binding protein
MMRHHRDHLVAALSILTAGATCAGARADDTIKLGLSVPLSGVGANWGKGGELMCKNAAEEIKAAGGVKVKDKTYNFECLAYDNKYTAAEGTKVAQTLLNRDGAKYISCAIGTAPIEALQSLAERQGALVFNTSWGTNTKGPKHPQSFTIVNTPYEIMPAMVKYITQTYPQAKTMVLLNANDASGKENEAITRPMWEKAGIKILTSDFYERGTTEFQPIAQRLASYHADIVDLSSAPPADAGQIFKELDVLGFKGVKITDNGTGIEGLKATGGAAVEGVYLGAAMTLDGPDATDHERKLNEASVAALGEALNIIDVACYDAVYAVKAAMEKAQSLEPADVNAAMPSVRFKSFYATQTGFGGKETYGTNQQLILPVFITQIENGKLVEKARIDLMKD